MRRFALTLLAGLATLCAAPLVAAQEVRPSAIIAIAPDGDDMIVTVTLGEPVTRYPFTQADVVRDEALAVETPGLVLSDDAVTGDAPFSTFVLRLTQDLTERDAKYPAYYRVGAGRLVYAPALYPDHADWDVTLSAALPDGWIRWPEGPSPQGNLFLGPADMVIKEGGVRFIFDGRATPEAEAAIRHTVTQALAFLEASFGSPPADPPFVATSLLDAERNWANGDVTDDAMIALRFLGPDPDPTNSQMLATTRSMVLHEGAHFWNGGVASFAQGTPQWLHEGGAEYIATLASRRLGWATDEQMQASLATWLGRCSTSLEYSDEPALNDLPVINASLRYSCGPLLHTLGELYLAQDRALPTIIEGWRETVRHAVAENGGEYDLAAFLAALRAPDLLERPALAAILSTRGNERWQVVEDEMRRLGVGLERRSGPTLRARTALMHMIRPQCQLQDGEGYGFFPGELSYRLDTPAGCGILAGNPVIESLAGRPLAALSEVDYAALQAICAAGGSVGFGVVDGDAIMVPCLSPLPDAASEPVVTALPDIPAFR